MLPKLLSTSPGKSFIKSARLAFPLLVRQALAQRPIFYSDLAHELGMPNPRNLDYVLGSIGKTLSSLSKEWKTAIPPIQCLVINRRNYLPGKGIGWFITNKNAFEKMTKRQKQEVVQNQLHRIYGYKNWPAVLKAVGLKQTSNALNPTIEGARSGGWAGGESPDHKRLKAFVAAHPELLGLKNVKGELEFPLPSGDVVDVMFRGKRAWVAAEIKSAKSDVQDIVRGIFQCIKYAAVTEAYQSTVGVSPNARAVLVLEGVVPSEAATVKSILGVEVIDSIDPTHG